MSFTSKNGSTTLTVVKNGLFFAQHGGKTSTFFRNKKVAIVDWHTKSNSIVLRDKAGKSMLTIEHCVFPEPDKVHAAILDSWTAFWSQ